MKRKGELYHVMNPHRTKIAWGAFYAALVFGLLGGLYFVANHIQTHSVPTGNIVLSTPYSKYLLGEPVSFTVTNKYNSTVYVTNECPAEPVAVYRQNGNSWVRVHDTAAATDCPDEDRQVGIPASSTVTLSLAPWHHLFDQAGNYRLVAILDGYNSLPYVDLTVAPQPVIALAPKTDDAPSVSASKTTNKSSAATAQSDSESEPNSATPAQTPAPAPQPPAPPAAKTVTVNVTSSGNYDLTSISLNVGDSIKFVYTPPIAGEVRTHFATIAPTTTTLSSVTLDSEFTTRTKTFSVTGKWSFKAADHSGGTGTITVQ